MTNSTLEAGTETDDTKIIFLSIIQIIIGGTIAITNIILISGFFKKKQMTKISYVFLSSLGFSDVLFGFTIALRSLCILLDVQYLDVVCRIAMGVIWTMALQSAICILLLSMQVGIQLHSDKILTATLLI